MSPRVLRIILIPDAGESRAYEVRYRWLRVLRGLGIGFGVILLFLGVSWGYMAARVARMAELEAELAALHAERARFPALARQLEQLEQQYEGLRSLFAPEAGGAASELWLPPPPSVSQSSRYDEGGASMPDSWPLTGRGFVTRGLFDDADGAHPGLDIAVPAGSYIRAAGAGRVSDVGEDATYGRYVRLDHENGYETLYAHASVTAVGLGEEVRKNEVIAISGSTGRSTAPHLHFEIFFEGVRVDPLELVQQP